MLQNKNIIESSADHLTAIAGQAGLMLMTLATITGMVELPNHPNSRIIVPGQVSFAAANINEALNNPLRREREESAPHYISYSVNQRTPSRSGKQ